MTGGRTKLPEWQGETYYGRQQVKPAPFEPAVVGGYIFLAGLSGASALLGALAGMVDAAPAGTRRAGSFGAGGDGVARRARYLALLAPTLGSALLVYDLHTPQRFYNMLRIAKKTSPMSIGTWILMSFSVFAGSGGAAQIAADLRPRWRWPRRVMTATQPPAAVAGAGLATYTAALLSATSTPLWAAAPRETAVRFASSSMATGAAALALGERDPRVRRALQNVCLAALTAEAAGTIAADTRYRATGVEQGLSGPWDRTETAAVGLGVALPLGLLVGARLARRDGGLGVAACAAAVAGSALFRIAFLGAGLESARRPDVSMRFAQPDNLGAAPFEPREPR